VAQPLKNRFKIGDFLGGFAGSAVALPQAMGLGVVLFSTMGQDVASGALFGLVGAAVLSIISGLFGATIGMISAPNGPVTMLLVGVFSTLGAAGMDPQQMTTVLIAILMLTGLFQILFASIGGGQLVKYIPYPVVAGLITGIGLLMIKSQLLLLEKEIILSSFSLYAAIPLITVVFSVAVIALISKIWPKIPAALIGLLMGIAIFHTLLWFEGMHADIRWVVGTIPSAGSLKIGIDLNSLTLLPFEIIITSALALTILVTTDCLITAVVADSRTGERHNAKKEIIAQGLGQIAVGLLGALGGGGTKGATLVTIASGGRRWAPVISGVLLLLAMFFAGPIGNFLPISVLAGVIIFVGYGMLDYNIITWLKSSHTRFDGLIALSVVGVILFFNLILAVAVGVSIAIIIFIRIQIKAPIIHRSINGKSHRSLSIRTESEQNILKRKGEAIILLELEGNLFFATADHLLNAVEQYLYRGSIVILHFRRIKYIDLTGMMLLLQLNARASDKGTQIIFCHLGTELGFGNKVNRVFQTIDKKSEWNAKIFNDSDTAFEYAENLLLTREGCSTISADHRIPLSENNLCNGMPEHVIALIESMTHTSTVNAGKTLFTSGQIAQSLFVVLKGEFEIRLQTGEKTYKRLAKYGPGTYFGEIAFMTPGPRTASAIALHDAELIELEQDALRALPHKERADLALYLLFEIGGTMGAELRRSATNIYLLEQR